jgi:hypothetical protein
MKGQESGMGGISILLLFAKKYFLRRAGIFGASCREKCSLLFYKGLSCGGFFELAGREKVQAIVLQGFIIEWRAGEE